MIDGRYEQQYIRCFILSFFGSTAILSSSLYFVYTLILSAKLFADIVFYSYVVFALNASIHAEL